MQEAVHPLFTIQQKIDEGGHASVFNAIEDSTKRIYAIKRLFSSEDYPQSLVAAEMAIMRRVDHKNIVKFHSIVEIGPEETWLVMHKGPYGLYDLLEKAGSLSVEVSANIIKQVCRCPLYIHISLTILP